MESMNAFSLIRLMVWKMFCPFQECKGRISAPKLHAVTWEATTNDDSRPVKKTHFCKLNGVSWFLSMFTIYMNY